MSVPAHRYLPYPFVTRHVFRHSARLTSNAFTFLQKNNPGGSIGSRRGYFLNICTVNHYVRPSDQRVAGLHGLPAPHCV
jgi:hypothetical protein